ncbi:MAG TPA: ABC transporter permease subunit [Blastocatellia bacterium]|nr:ABC transporter permease subunit [Blastocatellia bacterium]
MASLGGLSFFVGTPSAVAQRLVIEVTSGTLLRDIWVTAQQATLGLILGALVGGAVGVTLALQRSVRDIVAPYVEGLGVIPPIAFGPLAVLLLGTGFQMKVGFAALSAGLVMLGYAFVGGASLDPRLLEFVRITPHEARRMWLLILLPAFSTWIVGGMRAALAAALVGTFVGQILSASEGLGYRIQRSLGLFDIDGVWIGIIGFAALGLAMSAIVQGASEQLMKRMRHHVR